MCTPLAPKHTHLKSVLASTIWLLVFVLQKGQWDQISGAGRDHKNKVKSWVHSAYQNSKGKQLQGMTVTKQSKAVYVTLLLFFFLLFLFVSFFSFLCYTVEWTDPYWYVHASWGNVEVLGVLGIRFQSRKGSSWPISHGAFIWEDEGGGGGGRGSHEQLIQDQKWEPPHTSPPPTNSTHTINILYVGVGGGGGNIQHSKSCKVGSGSPVGMGVPPLTHSRSQMMVEPSVLAETQERSLGWIWMEVTLPLCSFMLATRSPRLRLTMWSSKICHTRTCNARRKGAPALSWHWFFFT